MREVMIIGASGHGKVAADIIEKSGDRVAGYLDDNEELGNAFFGYPLFGKVDRYIEYMQYEFVVAIGNAAIRERIVNMLAGVRWYTAVHPSAVIACRDVAVGEGTIIMANAVINPGACIGRHCIINTAAVVEHDNRIEDYAHISVGARLAGTVHIGKAAWIGAGAVVSNNLSVCAGCMVGAGCVVVKSIEEAGTYIGVPARRMGAGDEIGTAYENSDTD